MAVAAIRAAFQWCVQRWEQLQVELHGQYSVERLHRVYQYTNYRSSLNVFLVILLSPMPSLVLISTLELIPLEPISVGFLKSYNFRIRSAFVTLFMAYTALEQYRHLIPALKASSRQILLMSVVTAAVATLGLTIIAPYMAFPIPFLMLVASPIYMVGLLASIYIAWGKQLKQDAALSKELQNYQIVVALLFVLTVVYPAYEYIFRSLVPSDQNWFALLLPVIKLAAKNAISPFCVFIEDFKPEALIFNVEIFHSLFVAVCIQSATSVKTSLVLMAVDCGQSALSLHDINTMARRIGELRNKVVDASAKVNVDFPVRASRIEVTADMGRVIDHVLFLVKADTSLQHHGNIRLRSREAAEELHRNTMAAGAIKVSLNAVAPVSASVKETAKTRTTMSSILVSPRVEPVMPVRSTQQTKRSSRFSSMQNPRQRRGSFGFDVSKIAYSISAQEQHALMTALTNDEREEYVERTLQLLHLVEFVILVEYTEVIIPIIFAAYLYLLVRLPNHHFYPQLASLTPDTVVPAIGNVCVYAVMELASLVVLHIYLSQKLQLSPLRLLGFVLEKQWKLVQLKLSTWLLFMLEISLVQFGMDFSFKFQYDT